MDGFLEFLAWSVQPANFTYTLLLGMLILFWLGVVAGVIGLSSGTPEMDAADLDVDLDVDVDVDAAGPHGLPLDAYHAEKDGAGRIPPKSRPPAWRAVLRFFNIGEVPLMAYLSFFVPLAWALSMAATHITEQSGWDAAAVFFVPIAAAAAFLAKIATLPLRAALRVLNRPAKLANPMDLAGRECVVISLTADSTHGQAEIAVEGAPLPLNVVTRAGVELPKGARAVVAELLDGERGVYRIEPK